MKRSRRARTRSPAVRATASEGWLKTLAELHGLRGARALRSSAESERWRQLSSQRRSASSSMWAAACRNSRHARPRSGSLPHQQLDDGRRFPAPRISIIIGGSYIGLEFGQMYPPIRQRGHHRRKGSAPDRARGRGRLRRRLKRFLRPRGIDIRLNAKCICVCEGADGDRRELECEDGAPEIPGSHLLMAVGRRPNTDDLGLEKPGVAMDERGYITVDDQLRTNVAGYLGDGRLQRQGRIHAHVIQRFRDRRRQPTGQRSRARVSDRITAYALYIDPPLGRVGMTEAEVRKAGKPALISTLAMEPSIAREKGETQGS